MLQVTKRRARSLITDLHANMVANQITFDHGHCIDQLLYHFSAHNNLTWVCRQQLRKPAERRPRGPVLPGQVALSFHFGRLSAPHLPPGPDVLSMV